MALTLRHDRWLRPTREIRRYVFTEATIGCKALAAQIEAFCGPGKRVASSGCQGDGSPQIALGTAAGGENSSAVTRAICERAALRGPLVLPSISLDLSNWGPDA